MSLTLIKSRVFNILTSETLSQFLFCFTKTERYSFIQIDRLHHSTSLKT